MRTPLSRPALAAAAALLALGLTGCGGTDDVAGETPAAAPAEGDGDADDSVSNEPEDQDQMDDQSDGTSMPAGDDVEPSGEVSEGEAEAVGTAYLGLTVEEAMAQAEVDGRPFRVGEEDGEAYMLTEDYVQGRVTATVMDGVITEVVVEAADGPVTVS